MEKIESSVFKNMTVKEVSDFVEIFERVGLEFWDLVDLYYIGD